LSPGRRSPDCPPARRSMRRRPQPSDPSDSPVDPLAQSLSLPSQIPHPGGSASSWSSQSPWAGVTVLVEVRPEQISRTPGTRDADHVRHPPARSPCRPRSSRPAETLHVRELLVHRRPLRIHE
jgi:hypothetical protein